MLDSGMAGALEAGEIPIRLAACRALSHFPPHIDLPKVLLLFMTLLRQKFDHFGIVTES